MKDKQDLVTSKLIDLSGTSSSGQVLTAGNTESSSGYNNIIVTPNTTGITDTIWIDPHSVGDTILGSDSGLNWANNTLTTESDIVLNMKDLGELLQTADNRGEILLAYGEMIVDKLLSMPNEGGLNIPGEEIRVKTSLIGYHLAQQLAIGWGMNFRSLVASKVYKDGSFEFLIKI